MVGLTALLIALCPFAHAGDQALYERALALMEDHYLHPERLASDAMFRDAGRQLADRLDWLLVRSEGSTLHLSDGDGKWATDVRFDPSVGLPSALAHLEDAVRTPGLPIAADLDLRVEILRGLVHGLDRHSTVLYAAGLACFDERLSGTLSGVGATIGIEAAQLVVKSLVEDGPARRGGLQVGDVVHRINGVSTVGMQSTDAIKRIRGAAGTTVVLTVQRAGQRVDVTLVRDEVRMRNVTQSVAPDGVGVMKVDHFSELTHDFLHQSLEELQAKDALKGGLVVDLRGNTGGSLLQSADAADTFLSSGVIVSTVGQDGGSVSGLVPRLDAHPDEVTWRMPMAVVMDHDTASGSEILAGSLAHLGRAILVGTTSFGKGTVQKVYQIDPDIKLKLTVAEYLLRGTDRVADVGLAPDIAVEPYRFTADGAWWPEPGREHARFSSDTPIVPVALEETGWRTSGMTPPPRDATLDIACRLVASAEGMRREDALATARLNVPRIIAEEDGRVVEAFGARGIDWAPAPPDQAEVVPKVHARLDPRSEPTSGGPVELAVSVRNEGATLYRAAVRLRSGNPVWDNRVLPLGLVRSGAAAVGTVVVHLPEDTPARMDGVELYLEADGVAPVRVGDVDLATTGEEAPLLAATLHALLSGEDGTVQIVVENRTDAAVDDLAVRFAYPDLDGIELVDAQSPPGRLEPHGTYRASLRVHVSPAWAGETLPLDLLVEAKDHGVLGRWSADLPRGGGAVRLAPPDLDVHPSATTQAPGTATVRIRAEGARSLAHVAVLGGVETLDRTRYTPQVSWDPDKLAWRVTAGRRLEFDLPVEVQPGANRIEVAAEDRAGLRTVRTIYIWGDASVAADAVDGADPPSQE